MNQKTGIVATDAKEYRRQYYLANKDKVKAVARDWYYANKERAVKARSHYNRTHPKQRAETTRRYQIKKAYGLSLEQLETLRTAQQGQCGNPGCKQKATQIDHEHGTGMVRGILCLKCNVALGLLADDPARIQGLVAYLREPPAANCLAC